jgi:hypothetical protein
MGDLHLEFTAELLQVRQVPRDPFALVFRVGRLQLRLQKVDRKPTIAYTVLGWEVTDMIKRESNPLMQFIVGPVSPVTWTTVFLVAVWFWS